MKNQNQVSAFSRVLYWEAILGVRKRVIASLTTLSWSFRCNCISRSTPELLVTRCNDVWNKCSFVVILSYFLCDMNAKKTPSNTKTTGHAQAGAQDGTRTIPNPMAIGWGGQVCNLRCCVKICLKLQILCLVCGWGSVVDPTFGQLCWICNSESWFHFSMVPLADASASGIIKKIGCCDRVFPLYTKLVMLAYLFKLTEVNGKWQQAK